MRYTYYAIYAYATYVVVYTYTYTNLQINDVIEVTSLYETTLRYTY